MKLFTTALALAKLGPEYRFRTTLEAIAVPDSQGKIAGPLFLVGRGDPNLSNRKFPFMLKEEFAGPSEAVIAGLADAIAFEGRIKHRAGIVESGLFLGMAAVALIGSEGGVREMRS